MKVLVLGVTGMLGHVVFRLLGASPGVEAVGAARAPDAARWFDAPLRARLRTGVDALSDDALAALLERERPDAVINCVGVVKQLAQADDPLVAIPVNALLPHRLARRCGEAGARLVHVSTDCVFSGARGGYREDDLPDATDLYGRSKLLGEVVAPHAVTLRTSIVGPELAGAHGLVAWFLAQPGPVRGWTRAIFSGLPTVTLAEVIRDRVLPDPGLAGLYHVAAAPIAKHDLLVLVARQWGRAVEIVPDDRTAIDRSLDGTRFERATGWRAPPWPELVGRMHAFG